MASARHKRDRDCQVGGRGGWKRGLDDDVRHVHGSPDSALELVELPQDSGFSYACGGQAAKFKDREQAIHRALVEGAVTAGADTIVTMYHSCHRALSGAEADYPLRVVNFTDVIAEALGRGGHPDYYRLYKAGGAMDEAVAAARTFLTNNGVRIDEASVQSLTADIFNETGLAGSREAFAQAFTTLAKETELAGKG